MLKKLKNQKSKKNCPPENEVLLVERFKNLHAVFLKNADRDKNNEAEQNQKHMPSVHSELEKVTVEPKRIIKINLSEHALYDVNDRTESGGFNKNF